MVLKCIRKQIKRFKYAMEGLEDTCICTSCRIIYAFRDVYLAIFILSLYMSLVALIMHFGGCDNSKLVPCFIEWFLILTWIIIIIMGIPLFPKLIAYIVKFLLRVISETIITIMKFNNKYRDYDLIADKS